MTLPHDTQPTSSAAVARRGLPIPWGLVIALNLYATGVVVYIWATFWRSPDYLAAVELQKANDILGLDDGRTVPRPQLEQAYRHMLEAARLKPEVKMLHDRTERLRWRFDERHFTLDPELANRAEALAFLWRQVADAQAPMLVVGVRDRGWAPDQLLGGPWQTFLWSLPGALVIVVVWAYLRFSGRRVREQEHEAELRQLEADVVADERMKRRPPPVKNGRSDRRSR